MVHLAYAGLLIAACVAIHALILGGVYQHATRSPALGSPRFWPATWLLIRIAWWTILAHLLEIAVWAWFYHWKNVLPEPGNAYYFSLVTYTTVGYGDVIPIKEWRSFAAAEGLVGILMCGWSTGFFFAIVNRLYRQNPG